tara:strand:- start:774 stop:1691 length:918 start_codon:yes stop_codon:yes gene_type:complete
MLKTANQLNLFGLDNELNELIELYKNDYLPNKILLSGLKGIGKCTMAYHLTNFILSINENEKYDQKNFKINLENKSFKLIQNNTSPNFTLIDVLCDKKNIDISQIRNMIVNLQKSSFNNKPRIILIDNIEFMNLNSINALLKILEEPTDNCYFILINSNTQILPTLKSRCLNFRISLSNKESIEISKKLIGQNIFDLVNPELINYYMTPGKIYNLIKFSQDNQINLKEVKLSSLIDNIITKNIYKKGNFVENLTFDFIEYYLVSNISKEYSKFYTYFLKKINYTKKYNLDKESLFMEFKLKILNG